MAKRWLEQEDLYLRDNFRYKSLVEMAEYCKVSTPTLKNRLKELDLYSQGKKIRIDFKFPIYSEEYIRSNYRNKTRKEMREHLGLTKKQFVRLLDIFVIDDRKYSKNRCVDETLFENPSYNEYYLFGLYLADGHIIDNSICIQLSDKDYNFLLKVGKYIKYRYEIKIRRYINTRGVFGKLGKEYGNCAISYDSDIVAKFMRYHGMTERKTGKEDYNNIPDEFYFSFIRGFLDGDGHVGKRGFSIYSTSDVVYKIQYDIKRLTGIEGRVFKRKNSDIKGIGYDLRQSVILRDYIYRDKGLCMERKQKAFYNMILKNEDMHFKMKMIWKERLNVKSKINKKIE